MYVPNQSVADYGRGSKSLRLSGLRINCVFVAQTEVTFTSAIVDRDCPLRRSQANSYDDTINVFLAADARYKVILCVSSFCFVCTVMRANPSNRLESLDPILGSGAPYNWEREEVVPTSLPHIQC